MYCYLQYSSTFKMGGIPLYLQVSGFNYKQIGVIPSSEK